MIKPNLYQLILTSEAQELGLDLTDPKIRAILEKALNDILEAANNHHVYDGLEDLVILEVTKHVLYIHAYESKNSYWSSNFSKILVNRYGFDEFCPFNSKGKRHLFND